jgi:glyoxylase-like metal-dependent hydrolase (beta-lactamase superfamily II)
MKIDTIVLGDIEANCYCVRKEESSRSCLLIDPGLNPEPLIHFLNHNHLTPEVIVITHGHADHIGGVETVRQQWPSVKVAISQADAEMLTSPTKNLSILAEVMVQARPAEIVFTDERSFEAAGLHFEILYTPGHSPGGICLYNSEEGIVFCGDTLFAGSVGRSDFPGGDHALLIDRIKHKLLILPEQTRIYPGHGPTTTIRTEKRHNPFLIENEYGGRQSEL